MVGSPEYANEASRSIKLGVTVSFSKRTQCYEICCLVRRNKIWHYVKNKQEDESFGQVAKQQNTWLATASQNPASQSDEMWSSIKSCPTSAFNQLTSQSVANIGSQQAVRKMTRYFLSPLLHISAPQTPPQMHNSTHHMVPCSATGGQFITVTLTFCREHKASERLFRILPAWVLSTWSICNIKYSDQQCPVNFFKQRVSRYYISCVMGHTFYICTVILLSPKQAWQFYRKESLHQPGYPLNSCWVQNCEKKQLDVYNECVFACLCISVAAVTHQEVQTGAWNFGSNFKTIMRCAVPNTIKPLLRDHSVTPWALHLIPWVPWLLQCRRNIWAKSTTKHNQMAALRWIW